ncbi:energy transducer TonB [Spirosoma agri]|uniref:Energy transducer TonB n=1 Tax=Spirosoma agri TaxID=1987381 RepID=A0A6M0ILF0_9BACT|nr:energy transducer TonB [Spirosoma agri]NEU69130.1 energy transducer TonB [Spirosoma agri]
MNATSILSVLVGWSLSMTIGFGQSISSLDTTVFTIVEKQPEFPGGKDSLDAFIKRNLHYSPEARKAGIKGRVLSSFIVETDGRLTDVRLLTGIGAGCDEEAIRIIRAMPRWLPGRQSGTPIRVKYTLPIWFGVDAPRRKKP